MTKNVLITGSSDGIGAEIATNLSKNGYTIFLTGRNEQKLIEKADLLNAAGFFACDLINKCSYEELFKAAQLKLGQIDILINNAGGYIWSPIEKTQKDKIEELIKLNLQVPYELCRLAVSDMKDKRWGRIINIGSISGAVGEANASLYSMTKSGLIGLTKSLALELAEYNITVNLVNPGWVKTTLADIVFNDGILDESEQIDMIPQRRFIEPSEVASLINYLISENAKGMTGQSINLCAGLSLG